MAAPVALFQGYDSVGGAGLSTAVEGRTESTGATSFVKCDICTTTTELLYSLDVDQSLSVGLLGMASMSQKMQLVESLKLTTFCTSIVVLARHTEAREVVIDVRFRDTVDVPNDDGKVQAFVKAYGDSFLSSRIIGGEYYAVYTYYSASEEEQQELSVQMEAAGLFKGISVDPSLQVKIKRLNTTQTNRTSFHQRMSGIANPSFPSSDKITAFAWQFPSMKLTAPMMISYTTTGYERVPKIRNIFNTVARNRELLAGHDASIALSKLQALQQDIRDIQYVYSLYGGYVGDTKLNDVQKEAAEDEALVRRLASQYQDDPTEPLKGPLTLNSLRHGSPILQYKVEVQGENDGHGQSAFDDVDLSSYIPRRRRITSIQLRTSSHLVACMVVTYTDVEGSQTYTHGTHDHDPGSTLTRELVVRDGHFIKAIFGNYGLVPSMAPAEVVTRLMVRLDNGEFIEGGPSIGSFFSWEAQPNGMFLMGFRGRQGWFIDALQLVYASFGPAQWRAYNYLARL